MAHGPTSLGRSVGEEYPLLADQRGFLITELRTPGSCNAPVDVLLRGRLDVQALQQALREVVDRHDALRITINRRAARQVVHPRVDANVLEVIGVSAGDADGSRLRSYHAVPFDLTAQVPFRARLASFGEDQHVLQMTTHHLVSDGWSADVLLRDLQACYASLIGGRTLPPRPELTFGEYITEEVERSGSAPYDRHRDYWRERLRDVPLNRLPRGEPSGEAALESVRLEGSERDEFLACCRGWRSTPFMASTAAFAVALGQVHGWDEVAFHCPTANRPSRRYWGTVGLLMSLVVVRVPCGPDLAAVVDVVRRRLLEAIARERLPYPDLLDALASEDRVRLMPGGRASLISIREVPEIAGEEDSGDGADELRWEPVRDLTEPADDAGFEYQLFLDLVRRPSELLWQLSYRDVEADAVAELGRRMRAAIRQ